MGKHSGKVMKTHWAECWMEHPDCFWGHCIKLSHEYKTTAEYQAFLLFRIAGSDRFYHLTMKGGDTE